MSASGAVARHSSPATLVQAINRTKATVVGVSKKTRIDGSHYCDALGIATRRMPQHQGADETERRGVHSDGETEGEDGYGGEAGVLAELTETVAEIRERAKPIAELNFADLLFDLFGAA